MTTITLPQVPITKALRRAARAWRISRDHRLHAAHVIEVFCVACRRWRKPGRFHRNTVICNACTKRGA
jgi:hypothetical protein